MDRNNFDHYVAQHYIKRFTNDQDMTFIGNIHSGEIEETNDVSRVMGDLNWSISQEIEDAFTRTETVVANSFTRLLSDPTAVEGLANPTKRGIADFMILHYARSTGIHNSMITSTEQFNEVLEEMTPPNINTDDARMPEMDRLNSLSIGASIAVDFDPIFHMKGCVALQPSSGQEFILGDNPFVTMSSQQHFYMKGAIFATETYFWFPLNPQLGLFLSDGIGNRLFEGKIRLGRASERLTIALNKAEVYLAVDHIAGSRKNLIRSKLRLPNIGAKRSNVQRFGHSPLIFNHNLSYLHIDRTTVEDLKKQFS
jgi:hypothetical protein